jgi:hypothetical protein
VDTYCIKLKKPSSAKYFDEVKMDSIPTEWQTLYVEQLLGWGKLLSRFDEQPLISSNTEVYRSVTFGPFNNPSDVQIMRIEKRGNKVSVSVKLIRKLMDSTVLVQRKILGTEAWEKFEALAKTYITSQPSIKRTKNPVLDGSTTVIEAYLSNKYYFLERHLISVTDPDLREINSYLFKMAGEIFDVNCKKDTRSN